MSRIDKINQLMKREIGQMIHQDFEDPRVQFVTVTEVDVSKDLRHARVSISVLGDEKQGQIALEALNHAKGLVRRMVAQRVQIRYIPEIQFVYDKSIQYSTSIEKTLEEIHNEDQKDH